MKAKSVQFKAQYLPAVLRIERDSFGPDAWNRSLFRYYASACPELFLVARVGRFIAGYSVTCVHQNRAELDSIAVAARFRQQGVARALLAATIRKLRRSRITTLSLMVRLDNAPAICLYRRLGFERCRTVPGYYEDGAAAWRMRLEISLPAR